MTTHETINVAATLCASSYWLKITLWYWVVKLECQTVTMETPHSTKSMINSGHIQFPGWVWSSYWKWHSNSSIFNSGWSVWTKYLQNDHCPMIMAHILWGAILRHHTLRHRRDSGGYKEGYSQPVPPPPILKRICYHLEEFFWGGWACWELYVQSCAPSLSFFTKSLI